MALSIFDLQRCGETAGSKLQVEFTSSDRKIFDAYCVMADAIAKLVGSHCEVVVHSLEDPQHSAVKIVNGNISGRSVGAPLTNLCFDLIRDSEKTGSDVIGPYYSLSKGGKTIRSVTTIIRGDHNRIIGLICFNMDLSCSFDNLMKEYLGCGSDVSQPYPFEIYPHTVEELVEHMLREAVETANARKGSPLERNLTAIQIMMDKGLFNFKGAVDIVAHELGISRTTVYNYLRDPRTSAEG